VRQRRPTRSRRSLGDGKLRFALPLERKLALDSIDQDTFDLR
jgi:hypothetical protein